MDNTKQLAILFADIAGSTRLYEVLGNDTARLAIARCLDQVARVVTQIEGSVIKTIGDEAMCVFPTADHAGRAAIRIQETLSAFSPLPGIFLQIRIGFHFGEVLVEEGDVFGDAVNVAARMTSQAKAEQIITTGETLDRLSPDLQKWGRILNEARIHGKSRPIRVCELTWGEVSDLTLAGSIFPTEGYLPGSHSLTLTFQGRQIMVNQETPLVTIGRGEDNTLVTQDPMTSRRHARVEWRSGGDFYLVDQSTNGAFLTNDQGEKRFVHREEVQLEGSGVIGLGRKITPYSTDTLHYTLRHSPETLPTTSPASS